MTLRGLLRVAILAAAPATLAAAVRCATARWGKHRRDHVPIKD